VLPEGHVAALADREEDDAHPELMPGGQATPRRDEAFEERPRGREQKPRPVARVVEGAPAMLHAPQPLERHADQVVRRPGRIGDGTDATAAATGVVTVPIDEGGLG
jgi:hypothetical protein